ncbi:MAG: VanZ family protein [Bacillota bacterium]|nr:VanZ family protein [Bacillota bacterium]
MHRLFVILVETVAALPVIIPLGLVWLKISGYNRSRGILVLVFLTFLTGVFAATGIPSLYSLGLEQDFSLIPLAGVVYSIEQFFLNILLFLPLGILLPLIWGRFKDWKVTVLYGLFLSTFIELTQMFNFRSSDIDDIIANTLGAALGFLAVKFLAAKTSLSLARDDNAGVAFPLEAYVLTLLSFLVMFFVQPFIANLIWSFLA